MSLPESPATDVEAFVHWALDDARTLEERLTAELIIEHGETAWHHRHQTGQHIDWQARQERDRQRSLNPAYQPTYTEVTARRAAEMFPHIKSYDLNTWAYKDRPVRDISAVRFLKGVEALSLRCDFTDLSPVVELPNLRSLSLISPVCEDYRLLARCTGLRCLSLSFGVHWPELDGIETLQQLEELSLTGNLLVFPKGLTFPRVRRGGLTCAPLFARSVRDLPQFPACEFLNLGGVERLDGIEDFPLLRNLTLAGVVRDFVPLTALAELTCFKHSGARPLDLAPLSRLPRLLFTSFQTQHIYGMDKDPLRDLTPLMTAPMLRELHVSGCPPLEMEAATVNAGLRPWDDLLLAPEPPAVPRLRIIIAPQNSHPRSPDEHRGPGEPELMDKGVRDCEGRWVARFATRCVSERVGNEDWGNVTASAVNRGMMAMVECYEVLEKFPLIVEALREVLARLRYDYCGQIMICLRVPPPEPTPAQAELTRRFREEQDEAESDQRMRDNEARLENLYLYQIKQQEGEEVDPEEFAVPSPEPPPPAPWEVEGEDDEDDDDDEGSGNFAVKEKPEPPPEFLDDEHPLADSYRFIATFRLGELWICHRHAALGLHLMGRDADEEWPAEEKKS